MLQDDLEGVTHVSMDHRFLGETESEEQVTLVLVIREARRKIDVGDAGSKNRKWSFPQIAKRAAKFIDQLGHNRVTFTSCDNEPAIEALAREIAQARQEGSETVPERPPVVGKTVQQDHRTCSGTRGQPGQNTERVRWEHRIGTRIPLDARLLCWLVEFAAYLMNRCDVGSDGKRPLH